MSILRNFLRPTTRMNL